MKLNFSRATFAVALTVLMVGNCVAAQSTSGSTYGSTSSSSSSGMPGSSTSGTIVQPGSNPGAVNPPPPAPQTWQYNTDTNVPPPPQDGMMGSQPPAPMPGEVMMSPDGVPQDDSTTMTAPPSGTSMVPPPPGKSMAPPAGPMGPQNSPPPGPQSKVKLNNKKVSKR